MSYYGLCVRGALHMSVIRDTAFSWGGPITNIPLHFGLTKGSKRILYSIYFPPVSPDSVQAHPQCGMRVIPTPLITRQWLRYSSNFFFFLKS